MSRQKAIRQKIDVKLIYSIALPALMVLFVASESLAGAGNIKVPDDLTRLSIEDLMAIEFTTLSRKAQLVSETAAAVFVITEEDIRRSGFTSIPEALRMVPGFQVGRISADKWAISCRGFNGWFSNKLLVLIDGRTVYNTIFSGVYWRSIDVLMEDISRIEVIRGPGASLWGANAVNGVVNIVTKSAVETQGGLLSAGGGTQERAFGAVRYGGPLGQSAYYSAYIKHGDHGSMVDNEGNDSKDPWHISKGAGRVDWAFSGKDSLTFMTDYFEGESDSRVYYVSDKFPYVRRSLSSDRFKGYNLLGRWQRAFSENSDLILQTYYSRSKESLSAYTEDVDTFELDFQHIFPWGDRHEIMWGAAFRNNRGYIENSPIMAFDPATRTDHLFSFFLQDEIDLLPRRLKLIFGSKFEENDYTGWEIQPNARLFWTPGGSHTFWAAVSRAVRTPSRWEHDLDMSASLPDFGVFLEVLGNDAFESEKLTALEAGYRFIGSRGFTMDLALFYNHYNDLRTFKAGTPFIEGFPPHLVIPFHMVNEMQGNTYGAELTFDWRLTDFWRLEGAYSHLKMNLKDDATGDLVARLTEGQNPEQQFSLRSTLNLPCRIEWDVGFRYVDKLPAVTQQVPGYWTMDMRLGWRMNPNLELSVVGQNLIESDHAEFVSETLTVIPSMLERSIYAKVTWRF